MPVSGIIKCYHSIMSGSFKHKQDRIDRLLGLLRMDNFWTSQNLSMRLDTSPRTLMRDLAELREMGYPIDADKGRGGGIRLDGRWGISRLNLSDQEVLGLLVSLAITESIESPLMGDSIVSVRQKIASSFPQKQRQIIQRLRVRILVRKPASSKITMDHTVPKANVIKALTTSFFGLKLLRIKYRSESKEVTDRTIEPQYILLNWPVWYLTGWDNLRNAPRLFRVDRVLEAQSLATHFKLRKSDALLDGFKEYFNEV